jgi:hypothetical protein
MNDVEFKTRMASLPEPPSDSHPPYWQFWRHDLYLNVLHGDPRKLFSWPCIYHTMLTRHWTGAMWHEYSCLVQDENSSKWLDAITMPSFGEPRDYLEGTQHSENLAHQAYHIKQFSDITNIDVTKLDSIIEYGGGYGAMALVLRRLGFTGKYTIYDLPEFLLLQKYYLSNTLDSLKDISFVSSISTLKTHHREADLLIACYSISESTMEQRAEFLNSVNFHKFLLLYSSGWESYDNRQYFIDFARQHNDLSWEHIHVEHLPPESFYAFGY